MRFQRHRGSASSPASSSGAMASGGRVGFEPVDWFNGSLFNSARCSSEALDPHKRAQFGAHYTDRDKIMLLVDPVVVRPAARRSGTPRKPR